MLSILGGNLDTNIGHSLKSVLSSVTRWPFTVLEVRLSVSEGGVGISLASIKRRIDISVTRFGNYLAKFSTLTIFMLF